jgi:hypothetical protein
MQILFYVGKELRNRSHGWLIWSSPMKVLGTFCLFNVFVNFCFTKQLMICLLMI